MDTNIPVELFLDSNERRVIPFQTSVAKEIPFTVGLWRKLFPMASKKILHKLRMTDIGKYSIAKPEMSTKLVELIQSLKLTSVRVTESNGGLGGFTLALAKSFRLVQVVEIETLHANIIRHNLKTMDFPASKRVNVIAGDYMQRALSLTQDVIISDPPWGGPSYAKSAKIRLGFNNVDIIHVINVLYRQKKFKFFILLAPWNYDFDFFLKFIEPKNIAVHSLEKHYFIVINGTS
jgi:predicted RNA methylase